MCRRVRPRCARPAVVATSSFDCGGQDFDAGRRDEMHRVVVAAHHAAFRRDVVRHDPVAALALQLRLGVLDHLLGLGREADRQLSAASILSFATVARMSGFSTSASCGGPPAVLLEFLLARVGGAPVGDRGGEDARHRPAALPRPRRSMSRALSTRTVFTPGGSGSVTGPETSVTLGAGRGRGARDGVALLAGGAVGDVAHRIDRLVRRAGGDQDALAGERLVCASRRASSMLLDRRDDLQRLGHAAECRPRRFPPSRRRSGRR